MYQVRMANMKEINKEKEATNLKVTN